MTTYRFLTPASEELEHAAERYEAVEPGLGWDFVDIVEQAINRILEYPDIGTPYLMGTRRIVLRRFPFSLVYCVECDELVIVALPHHYRRPGYWQQRLRSEL